MIDYTRNAETEHVRAMQYASLAVWGGPVRDPAYVTEENPDGLRPRNPKGTALDVVLTFHRDDVEEPAIDLHGKTTSHAQWLETAAEIEKLFRSGYNATKRLKPVSSTRSS